MFVIKPAIVKRIVRNFNSANFLGKKTAKQTTSVYELKILSLNISKYSNRPAIIVSAMLVVYMSLDNYTLFSIDHVISSSNQKQMKLWYVGVHVFVKDSIAVIKCKFTCSLCCIASLDYALQFLGTPFSIIL